MPRRSSPDLFSISAAADALSRSRRTVTRALRGIKPDSIESGLAKWSMKTIISAVDQNTRAPINDPRSMSNDVAALDADFKSVFALFDVALEEMIAGKTLSERRALAPAVGPLLIEAIQLMRERDTADGLHPEHVSLRGEQIYRFTLHIMENVCEWHATMTAFNILNGPEVADEAA
jgi:hypothetical protein